MPVIRDGNDDRIHIGTTGNFTEIAEALDLVFVFGILIDGKVAVAAIDIANRRKRNVL